MTINIGKLYTVSILMIDLKSLVNPLPSTLFNSLISLAFFKSFIKNISINNISNPIANGKILASISIIVFSVFISSLLSDLLLYFLYITYYKVLNY